MSAIDLSLMTGYTQQEEVELVRLEEEAEETMFVMLSDVHLDSPEVMHKLRLMFEGFSMVDTPPAMFVLMGKTKMSKVFLRCDTVLLHICSCNYRYIDFF